ncbi:PilZ domain-containing protein [Sedimentibacter hydroxybenzoicus DSM 7310]|uniref:PilZ domain-containing protein n=1 Tax=Sedimentibacter hydroxybenzoicus DSM 7310 TaxID=1123245 RepID=A0A974BGC7_SEDHY|nr:PilZ domain-containing protein [Sedimentibacter hydroxybenzoicus]NYB72619.1 PilZ domain-containing protein [Sedimentibacter hydroxybenzoicus DSM 7310]
MQNSEKFVKVFDEKNKLLCNGHLLGISNRIIMIKGHFLPELKTKKKIVVEIYDFNGISPYLCEVRLSSTNQLNALIIRKDPITERRNSLKIKTDLSFNIDKLYRKGEDVTEDFKGLKITMLNLSVGGMLISSNYDLLIGDLIMFNFECDENKIIIKAKIIRIDKKHDSRTRELSAINYGCVFEKMSSFNESVITKYLFDRQLQLYRKE